MVGDRDGGLNPWVGLCAGAIGVGTSAVGSAGDAMFLHRVGPEQLGAAFAVSSALLVVVLGAAGARADRGGRDRLLAAIGLAGAAGLAAAALAAPLFPRAAAAVILVGGKQVSAAMELAFWVLVAERYDARQIRRSAIGLIAANGAGRAVGAFAVPLAAPVIGAPALIGAAAAAFAAAGIAAPRIAASGALRPLPAASSDAGALAVIAGARAVRASPVARRLFWLVLCGGAFAPVLYYLFGFRASAAFAGEAELAGFLGLFWGAVSVAAVIAQVLVAPLVLARAGVATALVVAPVAAVAGAVAVSIDAGLAAVIAAQAAVRMLDAAVDSPGHRLAQNLTPRELRGRINGFLDGVAKRAGAVAGGVLAALLAAPALAIAAVILGLGWAAAALMFRRRFPDLAVAELARRVRSPGSEDSVDALDARSRQRLQRALIAGGEEADRAVDLLAELDGRAVDAAAELANALTSGAAEPERLSAALTDRLDHGARLLLERDQLEALAVSDNPLDRCLAARLAAPGSDLLDGLATDADPGVAAAAASAALRGDASALVRTKDPHAVRELAAMASAGEIGSADRLIAARALAASTRSRARAAVVSGLAALVRQAESDDGGDPAARAEWILFRSGLEDLAAPLIEERAVATPLRAAGLELLAAVASAEAAPQLAAWLGHPDRRIARAAERGLRRLGAAAIESLVQATSFGRRRARRPALALLRELRVPAEALDDLIDHERDVVGRSAARLVGLAQLPGSKVLVRRVLERIDESAHTLFTLVEARTGTAAIGVAARRLRHARHRAARARALEALDAALPRRLSPLIGVLEPTSLARRARAGASAADTELAGVDAAVRAELGGPDRLARQLTIYALGDRGRSERRDEIAEAARRAFDDIDPVDLWGRLRGSLDAGNGDNDLEMPRSVESIMVLSELPLFSELSTRELAELAEVVTWVSARPGEVLCAKGEVGEAMYFVLSGEVRVEQSGATVATLGPGEPFGEMALFDDEVRSATVVVERAARLGRIDRSAFIEIVGELPGIALGICRVLSRRVRERGER